MCHYGDFIHLIVLFLSLYLPVHTVRVLVNARDSSDGAFMLGFVVMATTWLDLTNQSGGLKPICVCVCVCCSVPNLSYVPAWVKNTLFHSILFLLFKLFQILKPDLFKVGSLSIPTLFLSLWSLYKSYHNTSIDKRTPR